MYPDSLVECIGVADNQTSPIFLENLWSGSTPINGFQAISFNTCYNAPDFISDYTFTQSSSWVIIDQAGKIVYRMNDNRDPVMIDIIIEQIENLLP